MIFNDVNEELASLLKDMISSGYEIFCVGSELRSDDRVALYICDELSRKGIKRVRKCVYGLENCFTELAESRRALIIDAIYANIPPGYIVLTDEDSIISSDISLTTHSIPVSTVLKMAKSTGNLREVKILGISVKNLELGNAMSEDVKNTANKLIELLSKLLKNIR